MITTIKVSKLDAVRRQLETAVRLYFSEADPVSIHTLVSASYQILSDVNRVRGGVPMIKEQIPTWVRSDVTNVAKRKLNEATNFFKHANRDHDEVLEFSQSPTELLLYDAVRKYRELTGELLPILGVYEAWYWIGPGAGLVVDTERQPMLKEIRQAFPNATRVSFFREALPMISAFVG
jgi:hypothetical protein